MQHILDAIDEIHKYVIAADLSVFLENSMMRFACIKQMEIIGEASNHLSTYSGIKRKDRTCLKINTVTTSANKYY